jgi:hypothetical protein
MAKIKLSTLKLNENNPRFIKDDKFLKLCNSIQNFPKMMELRPIIIDENNIILGGNMRFKALQELGYKTILSNWVQKAIGLSEEQKLEFIIKDNVSYGEWDFNLLLTQWDKELLTSWDLDIPNLEIESTVIEVNRGDENSEWANTTDFEVANAPIQLIMTFNSIEEMSDYVNANSIVISGKLRTTWSAKYPPVEKNDLTVEYAE